MKRPEWPLSSKRTMPVMQANSVSSLPVRTFRPGLCRVPRWRIRMVPALHQLPAEALAAQPLPLRVAAVN